MIATKSDIAVSDIVGTHLLPVEIVRKFPNADSILWKDGIAEVITAQGIVLAAFKGEEDEDGDIHIAYNLPEEKPQYTSEDYAMARLYGSHENARIIAGEIAKDPTLSDSVRLAWLEAAAR